MTPQPIRIGQTETALHEPFLRWVPRVFPGLDFRPWYTRGGWTSTYEAHALLEAGELVANVSVTRTRLVVNGRELRGAQLGAVGCLAERRGRGLMRALLDPVLARLDSEADLIFLHANAQVLDFYPRFGFRRAWESTFELELPVAIQPATALAPRVDLDDPSQRAAWLGACQRSLPVTERFGARDYGSVALWHACVSYPEGVRVLKQGERYAVVAQTGDTLHLLDLAARDRFELLAALPELASGPIARVRFGFAPERWCPSARRIGPSQEPLFVRGAVSLPEQPFALPALAQT
jgi:predicted N-acetyltransferase YhbS